ncbi:MAG: tetratricopeptide repeat protein [Candidatus Latescibacterota bacterium]|nr:tetratricopeptide repeat protein [Candidatus Latescibacterota bacterium]
MGWGLDPDEFASPTGETAKVLHYRTGMPDHLSGFGIQEAVIGGDLPVTIADLGSEELDWVGVKELLRCHRVLLSGLTETLVNLAAGIGLLQNYLELKAHDGDAASSLADILVQSGELAAARELAGRLLALDPQYPVVQAILEKIRGQEE